MKKNLIKELLYWAIIVAVVASYVCYFALGWSDTIIGISKILDAIIKTVVLFALVPALNKICSFAILHVGSKTKKGQTVSKLVASITKYAIAIIALVICLGYFIEDTSTLITGVSMLTLVIGLGAQSLISDIVAGIFIVFEGDYQVGDVVVIDGWRGKVNEIGIRTTKIEDVGGNVQIINNSKISKIINNSSEYSTAVCIVGIEYEESIHRVENVIKDFLPKMKDKYTSITDGPYYKGVQELGASSVNLMIVASCLEDNKFQLQRDMNRFVKIEFDKNNIGIPFPQTTISYLKDNQTSVTKYQEMQAENFMKEQKQKSKEMDDVNNL